MPELIVPERIILPKDPNHEFAKVHTRAVVEKRTEEYDERLAYWRAGGSSIREAELRAAAEVKPYEIVEGDYNAMVNAGIDALLTLLVGGGGTAFNNANAYLGVGASATAWAASQTDLLTTPTRKAMKATYPLAVAAHVVTFQSDFLTGDANIVWNEWAIFNASAAGTMLNRKQEGLGTKASGTWTLTVTFGLA